jgi:hypothetical protein
MTSDDAEQYLFTQVMGATKEYADAAKRLAIGQEHAANRLAQAEKLRQLFKAAPQGEAGSDPKTITVARGV